MIHESEVNDTEVRNLATWLASGGQEGEEPSWYRLFVLAQKVNAPVWEVAAATGEPQTQHREWCRRAMVLIFAEGAAKQAQTLAVRERMDNRIQVARIFPK